MLTKAVNLMKEAVFHLAHHSQFNALARRMCRRRLLVLCYHSVISDDAPVDPRTNIAVTTSQFELHLRELAACFTPVSASQIVAACYDGRPLPPHAVLVTFDDGYRNNLEAAAPLLLKYDVPAIFFVTSGLIGTPHLLWTHEVVERVAAWPEKRLPRNRLNITELPQDEFLRLAVGRRIVDGCKRMSNGHRLELLSLLKASDLEISDRWKRDLYDFMTWDEVRQLKQIGFEIGAHTVSHPIMSSLTKEEAVKELVDSKRTIEAEVGDECKSIAYPNGGRADVTDETTIQAASAGYRLGFILTGRRNLADAEPLKIDRFCVTRDLTIRRLQLRLSGF